MKEEKLFEAIGNIDEKYVLEAAAEVSVKKRVRMKCLAAAACVCVLIGGIAGVIGSGLFGAATSPGQGVGGSDGITYMSYAGPVFPLSASVANEAISAERNIDFSFSPYRIRTESYEDRGETHYYENYSSASIITDSYVLSNASDEEQSVTLLYPFADDLIGSHSDMPKLTVNGEAVQGALHIGPYCGAFRNTSGDDNDTLMLNLAGLNSWEGYRDVVEAGYQASAFDALPRLQEAVTVYELSDFYYDDGGTGEAPTLNVSFPLDFESSMILTYGFNGGSNDYDNRHCERSFFIPKSFNPDYGESKYIIVLGDDIGVYSVKGYTNGGCKTEVTNAGATVTRYETTLGEIIEKTASLYLEHSASFIYGDVETDMLSFISPETFAVLASELICNYGFLSERSVERYSEGMLDSLYSDVCIQERIMYLSFDVTVPAGGELAVSALFTKKASMDFIGEQKGRNGYDTVTQLGSCLRFTRQTASLSGTEYVDMIRSNIGFDPENGITSVILDPAQEHYWIDVRHKD